MDRFGNRKRAAARRAALQSSVRKSDSLVEPNVRKPDKAGDVRESYRNELTKTIARKLHDARGKYGVPMAYSPSYRQRYTQEDIAQVLGLSRPAVAELEAGRRRLTAVELVLLAEFYRIPVTDLLP